MGDVESALAFVALRQARRSMPQAQWVNVLSLELGWMSPTQARGLVERAAQAGLLREEEGTLHLTLEPSLVPIPTFFRPRPDAEVETPARAPPDGFLAWLEAYMRQAGCDRAEALRRVAARQAEMHGLLTADAALLWVASEAGLDVRAPAASLIRPPGPAAAASR